MTPKEEPSSPGSTLAASEMSRRQAIEDQLRAENEHLREAVVELEQALDNYFELYDLAAVALVALSPRGVIQNVNRAASAMLGLNRQSLIGYNLLGFVHAEDRSRLNRHLLQCRDMRGSAGEVGFRLANGSALVRLSTRGVHTSDGSSILAALSDERRDQDAAREKQFLVEAERRARRESESKDQFIAMLSHELRTPLTPILADCSRLEDDQTLDDHLRSVFSRIARNARAEARLVDDLLDATGILRGKLSLASAPVQLHELLLECVRCLEPDAHHKHQEIHVALAASHLWVHGDALRLLQVFTNLLRNAIKFTPDGGAIHLRSWNSDQNIVVEIEDSGIGFAPESARRLFQAFEQLKEKPHAGGLGLGLTIAKGLIDLHDGHIDAASRGRGRGARFAVDLRNMAAPTSQPPAKIPATGRTALHVEQRVLLVEDHEDTADIFSHLLQMNGYQVVVAHSVQSALSEDDSHIDLVISDLGLPDGTGTELIRELQSRRRRPAIALSGFGMDSDIKASKEAGFDVHLTKPVTAGRLIAAVQSLSVSRKRPVAKVH